MYFKDRIDLWTTADDVQTDSASKVAGSAKDSFIVDNNTVVITDTDKVTTNTYTINKFTGHLTTTDAPDTIVYHYMGQYSDTQAYFRDPTTKKFFGVEATCYNNLYNLYER